MGDLQAIADALLRLVEDAALRRRLGDNARALSRAARFSPEAVHRAFEQLYAEMIDGAAPFRRRAAQ